MEKTKEKFTELAKAQNINEVGKWIKNQHLPIPFEPAAWNDYILALTGNPACHICGAPQKWTPNLIGQPAKLECIENIHHRHIYIQAMCNWALHRAATTRDPGLEEWDEAKAIAITLGEICPHGVHLAECNECCQQARIDLEKNDAIMPASSKGSYELQMVR